MSHRILFLHGSSGSYGADLQLGALVTGLDRSRFAPIVVLPEPGPLADELDAAGVPVHFAPLAVLRRSLLQGRRVIGTATLLARNRSELSELARRERIDLVHSNMSILLAGQTVAEASGARHVVHVREILNGSVGTGGKLLWPLMRARLERADALVCVSAATARQFNGSPKVRLIYDGLARALEPGSRPAARSAFALPRDSFVVAVTARISDWKGQQVLARALAEPPLAEIGAIGLVAGDPAPGQERYLETLRRLQTQLSLGDRLRLVGFQSDVAQVLTAADVAVVPSTYEDPLPQAALEAAAIGLPVVATTRGGLPEIFRDGETGILVPANDHQELARALRRLADDPARAASLGRAAALDVRARFSPARMLDEMQDCFEHVLR